MYEFNLAKRLSQAPVHLVTALAIVDRPENVKCTTIVPNTSISRQIVSILLKLRQLIQAPRS